MSLRTLTRYLSRRVDDVFTPDQEKVIRLLTQQGYSVGESCRKFEQVIIGSYDLSSIPTLVPICDYQLLQGDEDIFIVGNVDSIYYGSRKIDGRVGSLKTLCSCEDENCSLKWIRDRLGRILSTKELLEQLRQGY